MSSSTAASNLYQALGPEKREIRLVTIVFRHTPTDPIECKLATFALEDAPPYIALSYVWGDIKETAPITLNDTEIQVTTNLFAALQRLRQRPGGTFWIEALCINQSNTDEKNHQVPLMRNIFQQAVLVVMWLGEEKDDSNLAISMIETSGKAWQIQKGKSEEKAAAALAMIEVPFNKRGWTLSDIFSRDRFGREYGLSRKLPSLD